jgi:glycosyltransferase involved in cell wall biosynthesis
MLGENSTAFFSVIVPVYNRSHLVKATIESILIQTFAAFELILVDDGSTDDTLKVLNAYRDERIRVFSKRNEERAVARNFGATKASGKYLIFFDSDDVMFSGHLLDAAEFIKTNDYPPVAYTGYKLMTNEGEVLKIVQKRPANFRKTIAIDNFLGCSSVVVRRDIFLTCTFNEDIRLITSEDKELWLRLAARYEFTSIPQVSFSITEHPGRSLNSISAARVRERGEAFLEALWKDKQFLLHYRKYLGLIRAMEYSLISLMFSDERNKKEAWYYMAKAFRAYPLIIVRKRFLAALKNFLVR